MTINDIIKESIKELQAKKISITPDNYAEIFCKIASSKGVVVEDCMKLEKFQDKLHPAIKSDLAKYNIKTMNEFLTFLISYLNRSVTQESGKLNILLITLIKRLLQSISLLHDNKAKKLAIASLERIEYLQDYNSFKIIKNKWFDFLSSYDDSHIKRLKAYYNITSNDLREIIDQVIDRVRNKKESEDYENLAKIIMGALVPSIASSMNDELASINYELKNAPNILSSKQIQEDIKALVLRRVEFDKEEVQNRISALNEILAEISSKVIALANKSNLGKEKIGALKDELSLIDNFGDGFESVKSKLTTIANSLEFEADSLTMTFSKDKMIVQKLQEKVSRLEAALNEAKKESKKDFLTTLLSKKALSEELNIAEKSYGRYGINYTVCFFDIDFFKKVNDTFGHEAGDEILKSVGKLFLEHKRDMDLVGRYGGEEFLAILPNTSSKGAEIFANKVRVTVEGYTFLYKGEKIKITISCGIADRSSVSNQDDLINCADKMLYNAKNSGRNRVIRYVES